MSSATRHLGVGEQTVWGTPVGPTKYINYKEMNAPADNQIITTEDVSGIFKMKQRMGPYKVGGGFSQDVEPENIGILLQSILPSIGSVKQGATDAYLHTFKPAPTFPFYTYSFGGDVVGGQKDIQGVQMKKVTFDMIAGGLLTANWEFMGAKDLAGALDTPSFSALAPFVYHQGDGKVGGVSDSNIEAMTFELTRAVYEDNNVIGSRFHPRPGAGMVNISGKMDLAFEAIDRWQDFFGDGVESDPQSNYTVHAIELEITGDMAETPETYQFNLRVPDAFFTTRDARVNYQDRVIENLTFGGVYDATTAVPFLIELQNLVVAYA